MGTPSTWNATFTFFLDSATAVTTEHQISASEHDEALEGERLTPEQRVFVPLLRLFVASFFGRWYGTLVHQNLRSGQLDQKNPASSLLHRFSGTTRARNAVVALCASIDPSPSARTKRKILRLWDLYLAALRRRYK
jgi:hypothetical protein